ncbi:MAG: hypothetical protein ACRD6N_20265, partial [Pyrinomonadaceae bacterium]
EFSHSRGSGWVKVQHERSRVMRAVPQRGSGWVVFAKFDRQGPLLFNQPSKVFLAPGGTATVKERFTCRIAVVSL